MKEATGELNMTVVTVVAIAAVAAFFYAFIWPSIKTNILNSTKCSSAIIAIVQVILASVIIKQILHQMR